MTERHASLFRNGRNQAVRIPREFEMEGTEVLMRNWPATLPWRSVARSRGPSATDPGRALMAEPAWMLDTNTLSDLIRNPRGALVQRLSQIEPDSVCTSIVVACELRFGARRKGSETLTLRVEQLLASLAVLPFGEPADRHYADIRTVLERAGTLIGSHDLFIAAHARSLGLTLVTHNMREFERVPGLRREDWLSATA